MTRTGNDADWERHGLGTIRTGNDTDWKRQGLGTIRTGNNVLQQHGLGTTRTGNDALQQHGLGTTPRSNTDWEHVSFAATAIQTGNDTLQQQQQEACSSSSSRRSIYSCSCGRWQVTVEIRGCRVAEQRVDRWPVASFILIIIVMGT